MANRYASFSVVCWLNVIFGLLVQKAGYSFRCVSEDNMEIRYAGCPVFKVETNEILKSKILHLKATMKRIVTFELSTKLNETEL